MKSIIKQLAYQKKFGRYKYLFGIELDDIVTLGIPNFFLLVQKVSSGKTEYRSVNYFHLRNEYFEDYFSGHADRIFIRTGTSQYSPEHLRALQLLLQSHIDFQIIYDTSLDDPSFDTPLFRFLRTRKNLIYRIHSDYSKKDIFWIRKNIGKLPPGEVLLSLDSIKNQESLHHENIFAIMQIFKEWKFPMNIDSIRFESVYKGLYVVGPKEIHMDLSEQCNTNCNFCVTNGTDFMKRINADGSIRLENHHKQTYTADQILSLITDMQKSGTESLALGITGEPLIHPEIRAVLSGLKKIDMRIGFLTNGYRLLENIESILVNPWIVHFYINVSSWNHESFSATRPGDRFQNFLNVWEAIRIIRSERPDIVIRCLYVITPKNMWGIQDFIDLCIRFDISEIELKRVVPYEFSGHEFEFSKEEIGAVIEIIEYNKWRDIRINQNFDYILDEFHRILSEPQDPEDTELVWEELKPMTQQCYNPYFYTALFRNNAYGCGKFISKIGKIPDYSLFRTLFSEKNNRAIIDSGIDIGKVVWERAHKTKCSRCHHMDVIDMVKEYLFIRNLAENSHKQ